MARSGIQPLCVIAYAQEGKMLRVPSIDAGLGAAISIFVSSTSLAGTETILYAFQGSAINDGNTPYAGVVMDASGNLYGTTIYGGTEGMGVVYELIRSGKTWQEVVLHSFSGGSDGAYPYGGVVVDAAGNLYGGTRFGGNTQCSGGGCGVVYELSPGANGAWTESILFAFSGSNEGGPLASPTLMGKRHLFGTTVGDDACDEGIVFELRHAKTGWKERDLHDFCGNDGQAPAYGALVFDSGGNLYGTTGFGGQDGVGTVFELTPQANHKWTYTDIHDFTNAEGGVADGGVTIDISANLYGAEADGGTEGNGSLYELSPQGGGQWVENKLHVFTGGADGVLPFQNPIFDANGNLFGTTYGGGMTPGCQFCGVIYELTPQGGGQWGEKVVYDFASQSGGADGYQPVAGLIHDTKGHFYGTTTKGGQIRGTNPCNCGVVFEFTP